MAETARTLDFLPIGTVGVVGIGMPRGRALIIASKAVQGVGYTMEIATDAFSALNVCVYRDQRWIPWYSKAYHLSKHAKKVRTRKKWTNWLKRNYEQ